MKIENAKETTITFTKYELSNLISLIYHEIVRLYKQGTVSEKDIVTTYRAELDLVFKVSNYYDWTYRFSMPEKLLKEYQRRANNEGL